MTGRGPTPLGSAPWFDRYARLLHPRIRICRPPDSFHARARPLAPPSPVDRTPEQLSRIARAVCAVTVLHSRLAQQEPRLGRCPSSTSRPRTAPPTHVPLLHVAAPLCPAPFHQPPSARCLFHAITSAPEPSGTASAWGRLHRWMHARMHRLPDALACKIPAHLNPRLRRSIQAG